MLDVIFGTGGLNGRCGRWRAHGFFDFLCIREKRPLEYKENQKGSIASQIHDHAVPMPNPTNFRQEIATFLLFKHGALKIKAPCLKSKKPRARQRQPWPARATRAQKTSIIDFH